MCVRFSVQLPFQTFVTVTNIGQVMVEIHAEVHVNVHVKWSVRLSDLNED
jgi:hypothetical protein